jgi:hypothetical protein
VIKAVRELTMTIICKMCETQFGTWRPRCPTCGTAPPVTLAQNAPRIVKPRERQANECIFCHRRNAKDRCPHCNEPIHRDCKNSHGPRCEQFQVDRQVEIARVSR